jgi:Raf kinase inhibitor-like YbhB/YbcL family protein
MSIRRTVTIIAVSIVTICAIGILFERGNFMQENKRQAQTMQTTAGFTITSPAFESNHLIPDIYTCKGTDVNPELQWSGAPKGTESFVLIVHDPDAPSGDFTHWTVWNLPASSDAIAENSTPIGVQGVNDFGKNGWGGPCPPSGTHRYMFELYALNIMLSLPQDSHVHALRHAMSDHMVGKTMLIGLFSK